ncbi:MAG: MFS transporter, partial [Bacilli bacterium]
MNQAPSWERGILWVAGLGLFLSTLDTGVINIALPTLQSAWKSSVPQVTWTVIVYAMSLTATMMFWGRWADRIGRVRIFLWGLLFFGLSSTLCGASSSLAMLIAARAVQGLGAAMVQATAASLVTTTTAPERRSVSLGAL